MDETIREIKKLLRLRMNGTASTFMRNSGMNYKVNFGLDAISIREIAERFKPEVALAERLWSEEARECKILATLLYPKEELTQEKSDLWMRDCHIPELTEQLCFNLLQHVSFAPQKCMEWIRNENAEAKSAGYILLLRLLLRKEKTLELDSAVQIARKDIYSDDYRLQLTANRFLERATFV